MCACFVARIEGKKQQFDVDDAETLWPLLIADKAQLCGRHLEAHCEGLLVGLRHRNELGAPRPECRLSCNEASGNQEITKLGNVPSPDGKARAEKQSVKEASLKNILKRTERNVKRDERRRFYPLPRK